MRIQNKRQSFKVGLIECNDGLKSICFQASTFELVLDTVLQVDGGMKVGERVLRKPRAGLGKIKVAPPQAPAALPGHYFGSSIFFFEHGNGDFS